MFGTIFNCVSVPPVRGLKQVNKVNNYSLIILLCYRRKESLTLDDRNSLVLNPSRQVQDRFINYRNFGWLVGFGLNGPLRQYFSLYRAAFQREGEREEKG